MRVTRHSVFETNSSSTHSLTISSKETQSDRLMVENGVCRIYPGEFGWGPETHRDAATKAAYCLTHAKEQDHHKHLDMLRHVILEETKVKTVMFVEAVGGCYPWGYIDHQSIVDNDIGAEVWESPKTLRNFIFNSFSLLHIDNDNH